MEAFATGFYLDNSNRPKPGFSMENDNFKLTFAEILCDERKNFLSHGFESCYDWTKVMEIVMDSTNHYNNMEDIERKTEEALRSYLTSFQGWGLLSSLLPYQKHRNITLGLAFTIADWDEALGGPCTAEKVFNIVKRAHEHHLGNGIGNLVPPFSVYFGRVEDDEGDEDDGEGRRQKSLSVFFYAKWMLEIKFVIEKKRVNKSLLDLAAETVAQLVENEDDIKNLSIPATLVDNVTDKFKDVQWVHSYRINFNNTSLAAIEAEDILDKIVDSVGAVGETNTEEEHLTEECILGNDGNIGEIEIFS